MMYAGLLKLMSVENNKILCDQQVDFDFGGPATVFQGNLYVTIMIDAHGP